MCTHFHMGLAETKLCPFGIADKDFNWYSDPLKFQCEIEEEYIKMKW